VSNNGGAENYPFSAQKRSLEEAGKEIGTDGQLVSIC